MFKTFGIAALVAVVALVVGFGGRGSSTPTAQANTTSVVVVPCEFIAAGLAAHRPLTPGIVTVGDVLAACGAPSTVGGPFTPLPPGTASDAPGARTLVGLAKSIGNEDGVLTASDLTALSGLGSNQLSTDCTLPGPSLFTIALGWTCTLDVFVFVDHEGPVTLNLPAGLKSLESPTTQDFTCTMDSVVPVPATISITGVDATGLFTTTLPHGFIVGDVITISAVTGAVPAIAAGAYTVATTPTTTTFTLTGVGALTTVGTTATISQVQHAPVVGVDNDCSGAPPTGFPNNGDGVVLFHVINANASAGDVKTITVSQDAVPQYADINVVGPPIGISLTLAKSTIETNGNTPNVLACQTQTPAGLAAITQPTSTLAIAAVTDKDKRPLTRVPVAFKVTPPEDTEIAKIGLGDPLEEITSNTVVTVHPPTAGAATAAYAVVCGGKQSGKAKIDASINNISCTFTGCVALSSANHDSQVLTVTGAPSSNVVTADASSIKCDGSATSTVTAKVTDSAGNNVADGVPVNFSVVALGTANPINTVTKNGIATSVITPLSNSSAGTTVIVTAGDSSIASVVQTSVRVDCALPLATQPTLAPPAPVATPRGGIAGPDTGNGGYLGQNSSNSFPMWAVLALVLGSVTLVAGGMVTRRAGK